MSCKIWLRPSRILVQTMQVLTQFVLFSYWTMSWQFYPHHLGPYFIHEIFYTMIYFWSLNPWSIKLMIYFDILYIIDFAGDIWIRVWNIFQQKIFNGFSESMVKIRAKGWNFKRILWLQNVAKILAKILLFYLQVLYLLHRNTPYF